MFLFHGFYITTNFLIDKLTMNWNIEIGKPKNCTFKFVSTLFIYFYILFTYFFNTMRVWSIFDDDMPDS